MFSKKNRADKKAVDKIFKGGFFVRSSNLTLKYFLDKDILSTRISFIVPKTTEKTAVKRNLLRRRGYSTLKKYLNEFPVGFVGAFIFGKKSTKIFGGRKNKIYNPILNLENEIKNILSKL